MNDEIQVTSPARMFINGETLTAENIDDEIENVLKELEKTNDPSIVDNAISTMIGLSKISLFSLAHLLFGYNLWWVRTEQEEKRGDTFEDYIESIHGLNRTVMARYVNIWHKRSTGQLPESISSRPLKDQFAIADALDQGYKITEEQWEELEDAKNTTQVHAILRDIKGKPATKASFVGYLERDGTIVYWHQDQRFVVGNLLLPEDAIDDLERTVREKAKARTVKGTGLIEK